MNDTWRLDCPAHRSSQTGMSQVFPAAHVDVEAAGVMKEPRIAVPEIDQDVSNYIRALYGAGMRPILISVRSKQIEQKYQQEYLDYADFNVENYDGLLIPGGWDIDPARYGQKNRGSVGIREDLDELQLKVLDAFIKKEKPVLGICRGHQLINVYFGGSLIQHLETADRHMDIKEYADRIHQGRVQPQTWICGIYGETFTHNSSHHQAVDRTGEGLAVDGWCPDDQTVESMHHVSLPVFGVQWHPERLTFDYAREDAVDGLEIFRFFCRQCHGDPDVCLFPPGADVVHDRMGL